MSFFKYQTARYLGEIASFPKDHNIRAIYAIAQLEVPSLGKQATFRCTLERLGVRYTKDNKVECRVKKEESRGAMSMLKDDDGTSKKPPRDERVDHNPSLGRGRIKGA